MSFISSFVAVFTVLSLGWAISRALSTNLWSKMTFLGFALSVCVSSAYEGCRESCTLSTLADCSCAGVVHGFSLCQIISGAATVRSSQWRRDAMGTTVGEAGRTATVSDVATPRRDSLLSSLLRDAPPAVPACGIRMAEDAERSNVFPALVSYDCSTDDTLDLHFGHLFGAYLAADMNAPGVQRDSIRGVQVEVVGSPSGGAVSCDRHASGQALTIFRCRLPLGTCSRSEPATIAVSAGSGQDYGRLELCPPRAALPHVSIAACAIVNGKQVPSAAHVRHWLGINLHLGIRRFHLFDATSNPHLRSFMTTLLTPYVQVGLVTVDEWKWPAESRNNKTSHLLGQRMLAQIPAYNTCASRYGRSADYLAFFDIDELLVPTTGNLHDAPHTLPDVLALVQQQGDDAVASVSFRHHCMRARSAAEYEQAAAAARSRLGDELMDAWIHDKIDRMQVNKGYLAGPGGKPSIENPDLGIDEVGRTVFSLAGFRSEPDCLHSNLAKHIVRSECVQLVAVHDSDIRRSDRCQRSVTLPTSGDTGARLQHYKYVHDARAAVIPDESTRALVRHADGALRSVLATSNSSEVRGLVEEMKNV